MSLSGKANNPPLPGEEIVMSGFAGEFPGSKNTYELLEHLHNKVNLMKAPQRWDYYNPDIPPSGGHLDNELGNFDAGFFGWHEKLADNSDSLVRHPVEKAIEAIMDAGLNPSDLQNQRCGIYVGACFSESERNAFLVNVQPEFPLIGYTRNQIAHKIAYYLKTKGPAVVTDTACSSAMIALENAYFAIRIGLIDCAIVSGVNFCINPMVTLQFSWMALLSKNATCSPFSKNRNGYVRAETVGAVFLQKAKDANRIYAEVVHAKTNSDGHKEQGITYPSMVSQKSLMEDVYRESGISVDKLGYIEAHGTGTVVGDPVECGAIDEAIMKHRKEPLLIGSVKSNVGHAEPASGLPSIAKIIGAMETGIIAPNIHFGEPNPSIPALIEGRLKVVLKPEPLKSDYVGVSSFGFGGVNCHALLKRHAKSKIGGGLPADNTPRLVCVSGRLREGVIEMLKPFKENKLDVEFVRLLHNVFRKNIPSYVYRGYSIVTKTGEVHRQIGYLRKHTPLCFAFGELTNWMEVSKKLMQLLPFADSMQRSQKHLSKSINLSDFGNPSKSCQHEVVGNVAVQIGIVDMFNAIKMKPDKYYGYSCGELLALYVDGKLTREQVLDCAVCVNKFVARNEALSNGSGHIVNSNSVANGNGYHGSCAEDLKTALKNNKMSRAKLVQDLSSIISSKNAVVDNLVASLIGSVPTRIQEVRTDDKLVVFGWIPSSCVPEDVTLFDYNPTTSQNIVMDLLKLLGNLYVSGCEAEFDKLYPTVEFPVSRGTRMISPYIKWKHDRKYFVPLYSNTADKGIRGIRDVKITTIDSEWQYVVGHVIDGRNLFPATGYLYLVWQTLALTKNINMSGMDIVFEDCRFHQATQLPSKGYLSFLVTLDISGKFEVSESNVSIVTGRITILETEDSEPVLHNDFHLNNSMKLQDIYKELKLRGYNYTGGFRQLQDFDVNECKGHIKWDANWVTFMDIMLQMKILSIDSRLLYVPTYIQEVRLSAMRHEKWIEDHYVANGLETNLPAHYNSLSDTISSGYIKIKGLMASTITRKRDMRIPVLEKYMFVPNEASLKVEESMRVNIQIILENTLSTKVKCVELVDQFAVDKNSPLSPIVLTVLEDQPLIQPNVTILSNSPIEGVSVTTVDKTLRTETDCTIIVISRLSKRPEFLQDIYESLKEDGFIISREEVNCDASKLSLRGLNTLTVHRTDTETLVFYRRETQQAPMNFLKIDDTETFPWLEQLQEMNKTKSKEDIVLYSEKDSTSGILGFVNCLRREPETRNVRCVFYMDEPDTFDVNDPSLLQQLKRNMAINVKKDGKWGTYRHMLIKRESYVEAEHCFANTSVKGDLTSLKWTEGPLTSSTTPPLEKDLVYVYYASLNFRDVMLASGKLNVDIVKSRLEQECVLGMEFTGINHRGDRVMGLATAGAISTMVLGDTYLSWRVPNHLSLEDAATIPTVYGTLAYGLLHKGKMKRGDSILIHSGTGGIGLAAIRMAVHYGVTIYVTVGTKEKKEYLLKTFPQIKASNIGNSRDLSFEQMVMTQTNGRGVDIVLNSLAEEKLLASARCLATGGRFVEIGKFDLTRNSELSLMLLQKEASFIGVALDMLLFSSPSEKKVVGRYMNQLLDERVIQPFARTVFKMTEAEQAFRYMMTGKHIGKVILQIREPQMSIQEKNKFTALKRYNCYGDKCYVILGGLGGFGLELADWMVVRGCRKLVLTSRKGVTTGYQANRIKTWKSYGVEVHVSTSNVTTREGCVQLIKEAQKLGPIEAIYNLAVILQDAIFENQTVEQFTTSFGPKARATRYLDEITRKMCPDLKDFVVFSSVSCGRGNAGQTNYGMANSIMERICEKRRKDGYPALAIEWGAIGEVGLVAEMQTEQHEIEIGGTLQQRISSCMDVLNIFLRQDEAPIVSSTVVAEKRGVGDAASAVDVVLFILGVTDAKSVSLHSTLPDLGMDSMTSVEIKQTLEREFEIFLSPKDIRSMTLARLTEIEQEKFEGQSSNTGSSSVSEQEAGLEQVLRLFGNLDENTQKEIRLESRLKEGQSGPKVFFLPGTEGFIKVMRGLASRLDAHVIGFQYTMDIEFETIQDLAKNLVPVSCNVVSTLLSLAVFSLPRSVTFPSTSIFSYT
ncbi:unnamed protein product [Acanthoscelides obtectus]|uniref:Uncharacterized protein n=1 Tax=Acanthoscelides obtectus TaxID=200917 RepID=A0A9P0KM77_ACAOB|nr:unnamed protein product [Acanthoscelides obtectus]CAK1641863.1 Fatty acid synthase [Acanthoscelides obtectus]